MKKIIGFILFLCLIFLTGCDFSFLVKPDSSTSIADTTEVFPKKILSWNGKEVTEDVITFETKEEQMNCDSLCEVEDGATLHIYKKMNYQEEIIDKTKVDLDDGGNLFYLSVEFMGERSNYTLTVFKSYLISVRFFDSSHEIIKTSYINEAFSILEAPVFESENQGFDHWSHEGEKWDFADLITLSLLDSNKVFQLEAVYGEKVDYDVYYYLENISFTDSTNQYTLDNIISLHGVLGKQSNAIPVLKDGFTALSFSQICLEGEGENRVNIYYQRNSYQLTYQNDENLFEFTVRFEDEIPSLDVSKIILKNGYAFQSFENLPLKMKGEDVKVTIKTTPISYQITYVFDVSNDIYEAPSNPLTYNILSEKITFNNPSILNSIYRFKGWYLKKTSIGENVAYEKPITCLDSGSFGDYTLYANISLAETNLFFYVSDLLVGVYRKNSGEAITSPSIDLSSYGLNGYEINDWYLNKDLTGTAYSFLEMPEDDFSLYADTSYNLIGDTAFDYESTYENSGKTTASPIGITSRKKLSIYLDYVNFKNMSVSEAKYIELTYLSSPTKTDISNEIVGAMKLQTNISSNISWLTTTQGSHSYVQPYLSDEVIKNRCTLESVDQSISEFAFVEINSKIGKREEGFDDFKMNLYPKTKVVTSSDQLFYCLQSGYRPVCSEGTPAYLMLEKTKGILREIISDEMTDIEKLEAIYKYLTINCTYDYAVLDEPLEDGYKYDSFYIEGVLNRQTAVCDGISKTVNLLLRMEGIPSIRITSSDHAWNKVYLGGKWYNTDVTWGNVLSSIDSTYEVTDYQYFLFSDDYRTTQIAQNFLTISASSTMDYFSGFEFTYMDEEYDLNALTGSDVKVIVDYFLQESTSSNYLAYDYIMVQFKYSGSMSETSLKTYISSCLGLKASQTKMSIQNGFVCLYLSI